MVDSDVTVAALDIARIAGVGRAAVSNWRRRYADFPQPVGGTASSPLYSLGAVEGWLDQHGKPYVLSSAERFWQRIRTTVDDLRLGQVVGHIGAFLVMAARDHDVTDRLSGRSGHELAMAFNEALEPLIPGAFPDPLPPAWVELFRAAADLASAEGASATYERLCEQYQEVRTRRGVPTTAEVARLVAEIAFSAKPGGATVLDPSCGTGMLLTAARAAGAGRVLGQDADQDTCRIAASRLLLGGDSAVNIATGDAIGHDAFGTQTVDLVVCDPTVERDWGYDDLIADPRWIFGLPPRSEPELAWLQLCVAHLEPGGVAAVILPSAVASRRAGRRIRGNLLRAGAVRAIIELPPAGAGPASPRDLWVVARPDEGDVPQQLLMTGSALDPAAMVAAWAAFLDGRPLPAGARCIRVIDLLDDEIDLSPVRHVAARQTDDGADYEELATQWSDILAALPDALPAFAPARTLSAGRNSTTIGELSKGGAVTVHQAPIRMSIDSGERPVLTARDVRHGLDPSGHADLAPGLIELVPGDVVVPMLRQGRVQVISEAGALLGPNLIVLRPDPARIDPEFLAGCVRSADQAQVRLSSVSGRFDVRRVSVPRLPIDEQRRWGLAFKQLAVAEDHLKHLAAIGDDLIRSAQSGMIRGTLHPGEAR